MRLTASSTGYSCSTGCKYKINDTWNATGLCRTGSNDVRVADTFVAEKMTVAVSDLTGGPTPGSHFAPGSIACATGRSS